MSDVLSVRYPLATIREFRRVAMSRGQSLLAMLQDAIDYELLHKAVPGQCTFNFPPTYLKLSKVRQDARKAELKRRGR